MAYAQHITSEELEGLEFATFSGVIEVIEKEDEKFDAAIEYLSSQPAIGFDTETKPCFVPKVPRNRMAILQLSGPERAYIFRLQQVGVPETSSKLELRSMMISRAFASTTNFFPTDSWICRSLREIME